MKVFIRTDASIEIGTGHVMRCLTLAKQLKRHGADVTFICREWEGNMIEYLQSVNMKVISLPAIQETSLYWTQEQWEIDATETLTALEGSMVDLIIVDHYSLEQKWERKIRNIANRILVIDDLANRNHDCDILLDQNFYLNMEERYQGLVPEHCDLLLGPNYALLRDEFIEVAKKTRIRNGEMKNILVFFGGSDPTGETIKTLKALHEIDGTELKIDVVVGSANPNKQIIEQMCMQMPNVSYHCQVDNMAELMMKADLAIGAGGATTWERLYIGLPTIVISVAENQIEVVNVLKKLKVIQFLGTSEEVGKAEITYALEQMVRNPALINNMLMQNHKYFPKKGKVEVSTLIKEFLNGECLS